MNLPVGLRRLVLAAVDACAAEREAFLAKLVQTPSSNPPGDCAPIAEVAARAAGRAAVSRRAPCRAEADVRDVGMLSCTNLVVRRRFGDGPTIALNAHGDVVPPGEGWTHPPFAAEVADGFMYGRGVAVSKSDLATYAFALHGARTIADR